MGYLVLARKWRPLTFEEVAGQAHVTGTLANAIKAGRVAHAYLFTGPRGVGKTTTARILARALNCEIGPTPTPCGKCDGCKSITSGANMDVLEIDGASNRGIDDIRGLREQVRYAPSEGRYKVYIVDEVHMLTDQAFNALLKTLEEPPSHVVFVFATTSPQKIPVTILSRCQRFDFSRIPAGVIRERLAKISKAEKFDIDEAALTLLAKKARGSLRDAESLLDQVTSAADGPLDEKVVVGLLGVGDSDLLFGMCDHVAGSDAASALKDMDVAFRAGLDTGEFMLGLQEHLRSLFLLSVDPGLEGALDAPASELERFKEQASRFKQKELLSLMEIASQTAAAMKRSEDPRFHAELALARMCEMGTEHGLGDILRRLEDLEGRLGEDGPAGGGPDAGGKIGSPRADSKSRGAKAAGGKTGKSMEAGMGPAGGREGSGVTGMDPAGPGAGEAVRAAREDSGDAGPAGPKYEAAHPPSVELLQPEELNKMWNTVVKMVIEEKTYLGNFLAVAAPIKVGGGALSLGFPEGCSFHRERVAENANRRLVQTAMQKVFGKFLLLSCVTLEGSAKPADDSDGGHEERRGAPDDGVGRASTAVAGPAWVGGLGASADIDGAWRQEASQQSAIATAADPMSSGTLRPEGSQGNPLRRVLDIFEGEIVDGPGGGR